MPTRGPCSGCFVWRTDFSRSIGYGQPRMGGVAFVRGDISYASDVFVTRRRFPSRRTRSPDRPPSSREHHSHARSFLECDASFPPPSFVSTTLPFFFHNAQKNECTPTRSLARARHPRQAPRGTGNDKGRNTGTPYGVTHRQGQSVQDIANAPSGERTLKVSATTPPKKLAGSIVLVCEGGEAPMLLPLGGAADPKQISDLRAGDDQSRVEPKNEHRFNHLMKPTHAFETHSHSVDQK